MQLLLLHLPAQCIQLKNHLVQNGGLLNNLYLTCIYILFIIPSLTPHLHLPPPLLFFIKKCIGLLLKNTIYVCIVGSMLFFLYSTQCWFIINLESFSSNSAKEDHKDEGGE